MSICVSDVSHTSLTNSQIESQIQSKMYTFPRCGSEIKKKKGRWADHEAEEPFHLNEWIVNVD